LIVLATLAVPSPPSGQEAADRRVVIVTPSVSDARFAGAREAIAFWNATLTELGLGRRLVEAGVLVAPPISRRLETFTRQIWQLAGRTVPKAGGPQPPSELLSLEADTVVFFSRQLIFSFAWPIGRERFFVGISTDSEAPLSYPNIARNVIAHELGHTLGLEHNGNTATLMCGPCERLLYRSDSPVFFPLTPGERARLLNLHRAQ
jgi:hypothetical protein